MPTTTLLAIIVIFAIGFACGRYDAKNNTHKKAITYENLLAMAWGMKRNQTEASDFLDVFINILQSMRADPNYDPELPIHLQEGKHGQE